MANAYSISKNFFTVLQNWKNDADAADDRKSRADELLRRNDAQQDQARRKSVAEQGKALGSLAGSGVSVSSFNDALRDKAVQNQREKAISAADAENEASALKRQARKKRNAADLRYLLDFPDLFI